VEGRAYFEGDVAASAYYADDGDFRDEAVEQGEGEQEEEGTPMDVGFIPGFNENGR
jgi:hypothetical protein